MAPTLKGFGRKSEATPEAPQPAAAAPPEARPRAPRPPTRSRNRGWLLAGGLLTLIAGISAASIFSSLSQSVDVLVASRPIAKGAVISVDDYRVVSIAADTGSIRAIAPDDGEKLIGQLAAGPIGEGSILHPDQFTNRVDQGIERTVVVGAALAPNDLPLLDLLPGDQIRLFETFSGQAAGVGSAFSLDETAQITSVSREITDATVVESSSLNTSGSRHVAMRISESNANLVTNLIEQGRLAVALVDSLPATESVGPIDPGEPLEPGEPGDS
jgi:hypothetical protein